MLKRLIICISGVLTFFLITSCSNTSFQIENPSSNKVEITSSSGEGPSAQSSTFQTHLPEMEANRLLLAQFQSDGIHGIQMVEDKVQTEALLNLLGKQKIERVSLKDYDVEHCQTTLEIMVDTNGEEGDYTVTCYRLDDGSELLKTNRTPALYLIDKGLMDAVAATAHLEGGSAALASHPMALTGSVSFEDDGTLTPQQATERLLNDALGQLGTENPDVSFILLEVHDLRFQLVEPAQVIPDTFLYESYGPISENEWYVADIVFRGVYTGYLSPFGIQSEPYEPEDFLVLNTCLLKKAEGIYTLELNVPVKSGQ